MITQHYSCAFMPEYSKWEVTIGDLDSDYYASLTIYDYGSDHPLHASEYLYALGKGDDILLDLIETIKGVATDTGRQVLHEFQAMNQGSLSLIERNSGYGYLFDRCIHEFDRDIWVYTRVYDPNL